MSRKPNTDLRRGWTTGTCAAAGARAACRALWSGAFPAEVQVTLPRGETPVFPLAHHASGPGWAEVGITKDAGDDPDVTHGALVIARVRECGTGITFQAGDGVGSITKPGLPIPPGDPAINPVPRQMIEAAIEAERPADKAGVGVEVTISIPGGEELAQKTWNPRLGIVGGLSILGTTGIVRPFSCAAWIASIHRGIDVARAEGTRHVAGCTGATSERVVQGLYGLPDHAMLDMGDFAGGMLKYLKRHPVPRLTIGGGIGKITKLAQGAGDLHSSRSQVDFDALGQVSADLGLADVSDANTALEAVARAGPDLANWVAHTARAQVLSRLQGSDIVVDIVVIDRAGTVLGRSG